MDLVNFDPAVLTVRHFDINRGPWNFFDRIFQRIADAEAEMEAMRGQMHRLVPQDMVDVAKVELEPRGHAIVEEKGETKLKLEFDVHEFKQDEVHVKVLGTNILQVTAEHEEKSEDGYQRRTFMRRYTLPKGVDSEHIRPTLTKDGVLTIEATAPCLKPSEKLIPIEFK